ncbi:MAG TPA: hypothetical protein DCQ26_04430 [Marinilabiliales bacterium]|nr:MAG: hypothetical protein A2W95_03015 [Bacteroidetes bacterium GWA2_40_14]OFX64956.1 MAG: hypothetical protein A2W84_16150 [Bacteroidetes bacterium GWC2_40_13]OFX72674.1 MAG: hypothetical protein A2W96_18200 [Bacteroidetes bacterium GWD2_40_43]OFX91304.1 MAG: hypothetical protein A2W97_03620 [Bacteroidetes bacterium GWE2_40_63]OFY19374.1 MAG: hypothetical protein A2W88_01500 [Bacteroidetes bacterium GWF2_40_13]OFZ26026.1 MAG: hypothetical protein A2437_10620 [Bacteroidetes bacterium RIFOXYC
MRKVKLLLCFSIISIILFAQTPTNDKNWYLDNSRSDEFDTTTLDSNLWEKKNYSGWGYGNYAVPSNVLLENNCLKLKLEKRGNGLYYTGQIESKNYQYLYGYYEIFCKILEPGNYKNNEPYTAGLIPTFWTAYQVRDPNNSNCIIAHNEIDILEPLATPTYNAHYHKVGIWYWDNFCGGTQTGTYTLSNIPALFLNWHKFAVEFLPNRVTYYFDDSPFYTDYDAPTFPTHGMNVILALAINYLQLDPNTIFPQYQIVDYFRFYNLKMDCGNTAIIENQTQFNTFDYKVKNNITIGTSSSNISISYGDSLTFRMNNSCIIKGNFVVPIGSEFNVIPTPCY